MTNYIGSIAKLNTKRSEKREPIEDPCKLELIVCLEFTS